MPKRVCIKVAMDFVPEDLEAMAREGVTSTSGALRWAAAKLVEKASEVEQKDILIHSYMTFHVDYHIYGVGEVEDPEPPLTVTRWQFLRDEW